MFTFNGIHANTYGVKVVTVDRSPLPAVENTLLNAPSRNGAYFVRNTIKEREINVDINLTGTSESDLRTKVRNIGAWLYSNQPQILKFDDEPDRQYLAVIDTASLEETLKVGQGQLKFICPNPYATALTDATTNFAPTAIGNKTFTVGGNVRPYPVITFTFTAVATRVLYTQIIDGVTKRMDIQGSFKAGDVLVVDHNKGYITLNGTNAMPMLTLDSDFYPLNLGTATLYFAVAVPANAVLTYKNSWL